MNPGNRKGADQLVRPQTLGMEKRVIKLYQANRRTYSRRGRQEMQKPESDRSVNYYALIVAILADCTQETAFEKIQSDHPDGVRAQLEESDILDMRLFFERDCLTYDQIGRIYGMGADAIYRRLKRHAEGERKKQTEHDTLKNNRTQKGGQASKC